MNPNENHIAPSVADLQTRIAGLETRLKTCRELSRLIQSLSLRAADRNITPWEMIKALGGIAGAAEALAAHAGDGQVSGSYSLREFAAEIENLDGRGSCPPKADLLQLGWPSGGMGSDGARS